MYRPDWSTKPTAPTLTLKASPLQGREDSTSTEVLKCVVGGCDGIDGRRPSTRSSWSTAKGRSCRSGSGERLDQDEETSASRRAIAKHLESEYFRQ